MTVSPTARPGGGRRAPSEADARRVRYAELARACGRHAIGVLLTGHHLGDMPALPTLGLHMLTLPLSCRNEREMGLSR